jgi:SAM-dependent methyltransferase
MVEKQDRVTDYWNEMARYGVDASVIDPHDHKGYKNLYIKGICHSHLLCALDLLPASSRILDFGCGTGNVSRLLRTRGFDCYGIDVAMDLLRLSHGESNQETLNLVCYNGRLFPFADNSFEAVVNVGVLVHLLDDESLQQVLAEINRVLKPGGIYVLIEQVGFVTRIVERHYKKRRSLQDFFSLFQGADFSITSYRYIRGGHFPLIYAIRWGMVSGRRFSCISQLDQYVAQWIPMLPFGYKDTIFVLRKNK